MSGDVGQAGLLVRMHAGDRGAAEALWALHAGRLLALARAITGDGHDAADAVQEAFVSVLRLSAGEVGLIRDEGAYLAGAVRSRAVNLVRSEVRRERRERGSEYGQGWAVRGEEVRGDEELHAALEGLSLEAREVLALKHLAGLTFDQMGVAMGVPRGTAASRYSAALERLRGVIGERMKEAARA